MRSAIILRLLYLPLSPSPTRRGEAMRSAIILRLLYLPLSPSPTRRGEKRGGN